MPATTPPEKSSGVAGFIGVGLLLVVLGVAGGFLVLPILGGMAATGGVIGGTPHSSSSFFGLLLVPMAAVAIGAIVFLVGIAKWVASVSGRAASSVDPAIAQPPIPRPATPPRPPFESAKDGGHCPQPPMNSKPD